MPTLAKGGYASEAQAKLMRATAHGWKKPGGGGPSRAVANEFVDKKDRGMYSGGLAENRYARGGSVTAKLERQLGEMSNQSPEERKEAKDKAKFNALTGEKKVEVLRPQLLEAEAYMDEIGQTKFEGKYSLRDYGVAQDQVRLLRGVWSEATQQQARERKADVIPPEGMWEGGLAPMEDLRQRMDAPGLNFARGGRVSYQEGGEVEGMTFEQLWKQLGGDMGAVVKIRKGITDGTYFQNQDTGLIYLPQQTIIGESATDDVAGPVTSGGPRGGGGRGRRGRDGGGGERRPPPRRVPPDPPRIIPPTVPPIGGQPPPGDTPPGPFGGANRRAGRDTEYSEQLRAHRDRVALLLGTPEGGGYPPSGLAQGGHVNYYDEGGAVRPGHAEGANPYPEGSARYNLWERKHHKEPPPPTPVAEAKPEPGWLDRILGRGEEYVGRTERELEEMGEAYGGYVQNFQGGGLAQANFRGPPRGGVPPSIDPRSFPPQGNPYGATTGQSSLPIELQNPGSGGQMPWRGAPPPRITPPPGPGGLPGGGATTQPVDPIDPGGVPWRGAPPPRIMPGRGGRPGGANPYMPDGGGGRMPFDGRDPRAMPPQGGGMPGGPQVPPNMRGFLQKRRMMNRPPANVGGGVNRVGMQDQQGGLARALQRGTGRRPMSRRGGFPGGMMR